MSNNIKSEKSFFTELLIFLAVAGNILFVLWILINGINENFQCTLLEKISFISLMGLLSVNAFLLIPRRNM